MSDTSSKVDDSLVRKHRILAYNGTQAVCACDRTWKSAEEYTRHLLAAGAAAALEGATVRYAVSCCGDRMGEYGSRALAETSLVSRGDHKPELVMQYRTPWRPA